MKTVLHSSVVVLALVKIKVPRAQMDRAAKNFPSHQIGCNTESLTVDKGNNKITELQTIFQRESQNS